MLDAFAEASNIVFADRRYGFVGKGRIKNAEVVLLKPSTYMNLSGNAVRYWMNEEKIPLGTLRIRKQGSNGGHNGLGHIQQVLCTENYARLRFGIGNEFVRGNQINFVLGEWSDEEEKLLPERIAVAKDIITSFCLQGIDRTMNLFNKAKG